MALSVCVVAKNMQDRKEKFLSSIQEKISEENVIIGSHDMQRLDPEILFGNMKFWFGDLNFDLFWLISWDSVHIFQNQFLH